MVQKRKPTKTKKTIKEGESETLPVQAPQQKEPAPKGKPSVQNKKPKKVKGTKPKEKKKKKKRIWLRIAITIIVVCVVGSCAVLGWERWLRFDDAADFQGAWYDARTDLPITIDNESIRLTEDVSYNYELNTWDKSVSFSFHQLEGGAMYLFSPDRTTLYIVEGESRNIITDTLRLLNIEEYPDYLSNEQATILVKQPSTQTQAPTPDPTSSVPDTTSDDPPNGEAQ